jgi:predicted porin
VPTGVGANTTTVINSATAAVAGYAPGLSATYFNSSTAIVGVAYQVSNKLELRAGYEKINQSNASNPAGDAMILQNLGIAINPAKIVTTAYQSNPSRDITWIGGNYDTSAVDHVKVAYYSAKLNGYTAASAPASGLTYATNKYNVLAIQYMHDLSKRTSVYAVLMNEKEAAISGNSQLAGANVNGQTTNTYGVGIRHSF